MKYTIFEDPKTGQFAMVKLPARFVEGDAIPVPSSARWFPTHEEVLATLSELFDDEEGNAQDLPA